MFGIKFYANVSCHYYEKKYFDLGDGGVLDMCKGREEVRPKSKVKEVRCEAYSLAGEHGQRQSWSSRGKDKVELNIRRS